MIECAFYKNRQESDRNLLRETIKNLPLVSAKDIKGKRRNKS